MPDVNDKINKFTITEVMQRTHAAKVVYADPPADCHCGVVLSDEFYVYGAAQGCRRCFYKAGGNLVAGWKRFFKAGDRFIQVEGQ